MNLPVHVGLRVVDDLMHVSAFFHPIIRTQRIAVDGCADGDVLGDNLFKMMLPSSLNDLQPKGITYLSAKS